MILVHWKVKTGEYVARDQTGSIEAIVPVYKEGNQKFHPSVSVEHIIDFISLHQEVKKKDVVVCNVIDNIEIKRGK